MKNNKILIKLWLAFLLIAPIVLWIMPADFFDNGEVILCPSRLFFDFECFGCGITRAIMHLHHLNFEEAIFYNSFVYIIYPLLAIIWFMWVKSAWNEIKQPETTAAA